MLTELTHAFDIARLTLAASFKIRLWQRHKTLATSVVGYGLVTVYGLRCYVWLFDFDIHDNVTLTSLSIWLWQRPCPFDFGSTLDHLTLAESLTTCLGQHHWTICFCNTIAQMRFHPPLLLFLLLLHCALLLLLVQLMHRWNHAYVLSQSAYIIHRIPWWCLFRIPRALMAFASSSVGFCCALVYFSFCVGYGSITYSTVCVGFFLMLAFLWF